MPKAYIIAQSAISYRRYITRSAGNGYHCKKHAEACFLHGGDRGDRTPDLTDVNRALWPAELCLRIQFFLHIFRQFTDNISVTYINHFRNHCIGNIVLRKCVEIRLLHRRAMITTHNNIREHLSVKLPRRRIAIYSNMCLPIQFKKLRKNAFFNFEDCRVGSERMVDIRAGFL